MVESPSLETTAALFLAVAPLPLSMSEWITWRAQTLLAQPQEGLPIGQGVSAEAAMSIADTSIGWQAAVEAVLQRSRRYPGALVRLPNTQARLGPVAAHLHVEAAEVSTAAWLLASAESGPALILGCALAHATPAQTDVTAALLASLHTLSDADFSILLKGEAPRWLETVAAAGIRDDRFHLVSIYRDATASAEAVDARYLQIHNSEEADTANHAPEYRFEGSTLQFAHVGFSFTTLCAENIADALYLLSSVTMAQITWAAQRHLEETLRLRTWDPGNDKNSDVTVQLNTFERLKLELKLFDLGRQAFRESLLPWQGRFFDRYVQDWNITASSMLLEDTTDHIARFLDANVRVQSLDSSKRQSFILYVIALLGVLGVAGTASAYNDLLHDVPSMHAIYQNQAYIGIVGALFVLTLTLTVVGIVIGMRKR